MVTSLLSVPGSMSPVVQGPSSPSVSLPLSLFFCLPLPLSFCLPVSASIVSLFPYVPVSLCLSVFLSPSVFFFKFY